MTLDPSIFGALGVRPKSVQDYTTENQNLQQNALNLQMGQQKLDAYTQDQAERQNLRNLLSGQTLDLSNPADQNKLYSVAPTLAPGILKTHQEGLTSAALASKDTAQARDYGAAADQKQYDLHRSIIDHGMQAVAQSSTPDQARAQITDGVQRGFWSMADGQQKLASVPDDPQQFQQWRLAQMAQLMSAHDQYEANKPVVGTRNVGNAIQNTATNPMTGVPTVTATTPLAVSPDTAANNATSRANNAATLEVEKVKADPFGILGLNKNVPPTTAAAGGLSGEPFLATLPPAVANQVKMLAEGRTPITAMSSRSPQMMQLLGLAAQYEPGTDATTYIQRAQTVKDFAPGGKDGQAITNLNTALHHAGQLSDAIGNLNNSNILPGIVNPVANVVGQQVLGNTAQGVYKQKADALSSELRKVYAGGGGGSLSELNEWQKSFDPNASETQQRAYLQSGMELLIGALQAKKDAYERGIGPRANFGNFITPESKAVLTRLAPAYAATLGSAGPAGVAPATIPTVPSGFKITHINGQPQ